MSVSSQLMAESSRYAVTVKFPDNDERIYYFNTLEEAWSFERGVRVGRDDEDLEHVAVWRQHWTQLRAEEVEQ